MNAFPAEVWWSFASLAALLVFQKGWKLVRPDRVLVRWVQRG